MTNYYVYPDGTITEEPLEFMSDDYFIIQEEDYEEAYEQALMGLIWQLLKPKDLSGTTNWGTGCTTGIGEDLFYSEVHIREQRIHLYNVQICVIIVF